MQNTSNTLTPLEFYTVAIGASAGGLEAIHEFFDNMPSSRNIAFVIIQHLSPDYKSLLVELIAKHTEMQVVEAAHNMPLQKNCVHVIPNDKLLTVEGGKLQLNNKKQDKAPNTAIDIFLNSLAKDQGRKAIAVILSGTGTDGSRGIEAIHQNGGLVMVQDPISAKFDGMPNSAIATGYTDLILTPELMPEEIFEYIHEAPVKRFKKGGPDESNLPEVLQLIEKQCGHDFHNYKSPTILRRIVRRMGHLGKSNFKDYLSLLRSDPKECQTLGKEFLIGVTKFFRDSAAFDIVKNSVLPQLIDSKEEGDVLKVWVTACSTGQEAYSLAIVIDDLLRSKQKHLEVKIFATDMDAEAIEFAAKSTYPIDVLHDMPRDWTERYFIRHTNSVTVIPQIRKQIVFARHNILKDPPFIKNDLVTCRNMLIYMNSMLQRKVLSTLLFSANTGGYIFLGPSEIPASIKSSIEEIDGKWKIYKKTSDTNPYKTENFTGSYNIAKRNWQQPPVVKDVKSKDKSLVDDFQKILIDELQYAAIYIDDQNEIKEAVGDFRQYLSLPEKIVTLNVLKMVSPELSVALNTALRKANKEKKRVKLFGVRISDGNNEKFVNLFVQPASKGGYTTIVFSEGHETNIVKNVGDFIPQPHHAEVNNYVAELEEELKETRTNLQMAVESLETTNEELQSSNEELLSANEELQSSNEELQSLNEELHTLNAEHQLRIKELVELNDDLDNYFRSSQIGQVFVDSNLRIRKFNSAAIQMINLIESDIGRPIDHISTNIKVEKLTPLVQQVRTDNKLVEKEIQLQNGTTSLMRILPYLRQDGISDGVVITFFDITANKQLDNIVKGVFNTSLSAIIVMEAKRNYRGFVEDFICLAGNYALDNFLQQESDEYIGGFLRKDFPQLNESFFEKCVHVVSSGKPLNTEMQFETEGGVEWFEVIIHKMADGFVATFTNVNDKKLSQEKLKKSYHELIVAKEKLKALNAGLEEKVMERTQELSQSEERFRLIANATSDAIWDWSLVNNEVWWSESFYTLFGYSKDDVFTGNNLFRIQNIHPDDQQRVVESINNAINNAAEQWSATYRFRKKDGSFAIILDKGSVIKDEAGTPYRMLGSMEDITQVELTAKKLEIKNEELQQLFEEFRFVTDFMPQMVWATQPDGYHDFYNKRWYDFTGMNYEQTKNKGWAQLLHPEDFERAWTVWQESLRTGKDYEIEYRMRRHDGVYRWLLARAMPLRDDAGNIVKWFGTCTDIHDQRMMSDVLEQKVAERTQELQRINLELEASNNELLQFASVASHDLKEPLRKIHIFSNLIKDRYMQNSESSALDYMNRIINSSARMTRLIDELLTFSRLSINSFFERTDMNEVIGEVLSDLELMIKEKGATIEVDNFPEIDVVPGQMRQVFQNIISNALKFTRPDLPPHITIRCERISQCRIKSSANKKGGFVRISIADNGIGFDEQYAQKIFTIFQRLHSRERYEGTGIGLAITKKIIEKHNGIISAESKAGEGATFIIVLPIDQTGSGPLNSNDFVEAEHLN